MMFYTCSYCKCLAIVCFANRVAAELASAHDAATRSKRRVIAPGNYGLVAIVVVFGVGAIVSVATGKALSGRYLSHVVKRAEAPILFWFLVGLYVFVAGGVAAIFIKYRGQ